MAETSGTTVAPVDMRDYFKVLWRRRWTILLVVVLTVGAALALSLRQEKVYKAWGQLVLGTQNLSESDVATQAKVMESQALHTLAVFELPNAVGVSTTQDGSSTLITVSAEARNPKQAADSVNAHIDAYIEYDRRSKLDQYLNLALDTQSRLNSILQRIAAIPPPAAPIAPGQGTGNPDLDALITQRDTLQSQLRALQVDPSISGSAINVVERATPAATSIRPKPLQDALIALGAGLLLGIALAFLREFLDDSIKTGDDLQRAVGGDVPLLGQIPRIRSRRKPLVVLSQPHSAAAESYRSLRTAMSFAGLDRGTCFELTSAKAREGKTIAVANLAIATAQAGKRVVLVDCDLRRPGIHELLGLPNDRGFTSAVLGDVLFDTLQQVPGIENLHVLTSGPLPPNPSEVLASDRSRDILKSLQADGALVFVDAAPLLPVTDAVVLSRAVDAVVVVASAGRSTGKYVRSAVGALRQVGAPIVGLVLTHAEKPGSGDSYYGGTTRLYSRGRGRARRRANATTNPAVASNGQSGVAHGLDPQAGPAGTGGSSERQDFTSNG